MVDPKIIKCGNSGAVLTAVSPVPADAPARRRAVPLHFGGSNPLTGGFRLVARLAHGCAVLALADSANEAVRAANGCVADAPEGALGVEVERWDGAATAGRWVPVRLTPGALPRLPRPPRARRARIG